MATTTVAHATQQGLQNAATMQLHVAQEPPQQPAKRATKKRIRIQTEKRKEQNRSNQRAFRQRRERYVKDLEVSHHNLRHLVTHQGGEIEDLRARLVDLSGGKEGAEISPTLKAAMLDNDPFVVGQDMGSQYDSTGSPGPSEASEDGTADSLVSPLSPPKLAKLPGQHQLADIPELVPLSLPTESSAIPSSSTPTMAMPVPTKEMAANAQQFWSSPTAQVPLLSSSYTSSSSLASSWCEAYTPPTPSTTFFDNTPQFQPFLTSEPAPWQPEVDGYVNDFSHWLQQSAQSSQFCLPHQEFKAPSAFSEFGFQNEAMPGHSYSGSGAWSVPNALGLDNLFPNLNSAVTPHQLLGRPPTPFASIPSPAAEYAFAT